MSNLFHKPKYTNVKRLSEVNVVPSEAWVKCDSCAAQLLRKQVLDNLYMCPQCNHHFRMPARSRLRSLVDEGSFEERFEELTTSDPLKFTDAKESYAQRVRKTIEKQGMNEGVIVGVGSLMKHRVVVGVMDFYFFGGSMGSAVGEKIYQAMRLSLELKLPLILVSSSGGARMHEGILSLMQMAKTCSGLQALEKARLPYISILTDPTMGGVTASFASLGDLVIAEPGSLIGFAGPRVIEQTIRQKLPKGFQTAEFLLEHGFVDMIVSRNDMKHRLADLLNFFKN